MAAVRAARRQSILATSEQTQPLERTLARFVDVLGAINEERRAEMKALRDSHTALLVEARQERLLLRALEDRVAGLTWVLLAALAVLLILGYVALTSSSAPVLAQATAVYTNAANTTHTAVGGMY